MMTRGERNCNPGNLRDAGIAWQGLTGNDGGFCIFDTVENGIRALAKTLLYYNRKHGLNTVQDIIMRYAPSNENNTQAYVNAVCKEVSMSPLDRFSFADDGPDNLFMREFVTAIIRHENGRVAYDDDVIDEGVKRALV